MYEGINNQWKCNSCSLCHEVHCNCGLGMMLNKILTLGQTEQRIRAKPPNNYIVNLCACVYICVWNNCNNHHADVIKWNHFPRYWPFVRGNHRGPVNSPHKGQWRGALMCSLICAWINDYVNSREAGGSRRYRDHYDVIVMWLTNMKFYYFLCLDSVFGMDGFTVMELDCVNDGPIIRHLRSRPHVTMIIDKDCFSITQVDSHGCKGYKLWQAGR